MPQEIVIPVKLRVWPMVLGLMLFGPGAYFLYFAALEADPSESQEMWIGFACCALFSLLAVVSLILGTLSKERLVLGLEEIQLPRGIFSRNVPRIRYSDITTMNEVKISGQRMIAFSAKGKSYSISALLLPRAYALAEITYEIQKRVAIARGVYVR